MITVIVNFPAPAGATVESMWDAFKTTAPNYEGLPLEKATFSTQRMALAGAHIYGRAENRPRLFL